MATSSAMGTSNMYIKYSIECIQNSQNISGNSSNVTVRVRFWRTNTGYTTYGTGTVYCKINGTTYSAGVTPSQGVTSGGIYLFSKTLDIAHNADGSKTLSMSAWISHERVTSSEQGYNQTLSTIPRASSLKLSATTMNAGASVTLTITRASSNFTHDAYFLFGTKTYPIAGGLTTSATYTIPMDCLTQIPNATSGVGTIRLYTLSGGSIIGTADVGVTINAPSSVVPTFTSLGIARVDNGVPSAWGVYVQGKSKATLTINGAAGVYGSTISKYVITGGGYSGTSSSLTTGPLNASGTNTFTATITDSRGRTATKTVTCSVVAYSPPKITSFVVARCTSNGTLSDEGTYVKVTPTFTYSTVSSKNTLTSVVAYKTVAATSWSANTTVKTGTATIIGGGGVSANSSYVARLTLTDAFGSVTITANIPTASTTLDFRSGGKGIGIGKVSEKDGLEIDWNSYFNKPIYFNTDENAKARIGHDTSTGDVYISNTNNNWFRIKPDKTLSMAGYKVYTAMDKPTPSELGALPDTGAKHNGTFTIAGSGKELHVSCGASDVYIHNSKSNSYLQFNDNGHLYINDMLIGTTIYPIVGRDTQRWFKRMAPILDDGVMEVGRYMDFHKDSVANNDYNVRLDANGSNLWCSTSITQGSDRELKENIRYIDEQPMLLSEGVARSSLNLKKSTVDNSEESLEFRDFVKKLRLATYNYIGSDGSCFGFIAQDIADNPIGQLLLCEHEMDVVNKEKNTIDGVKTTYAYNLSDYTSVIAKALQEEILIRDNQIESLRNDVEQKDQKINSLEERLSKLETLINNMISKEE